MASMQRNVYSSPYEPPGYTPRRWSCGGVTELKPADRQNWFVDNRNFVVRRNHGPSNVALPLAKASGNTYLPGTPRQLSSSQGHRTVDDVRNFASRETTCRPRDHVIENCDVTDVSSEDAGLKTSGFTNDNVKSLHVSVDDAAGLESLASSRVTAGVANYSQTFIRLDEDSDHQADTANDNDVRDCSDVIRSDAAQDGTDRSQEAVPFADTAPSDVMTQDHQKVVAKREKRIRNKRRSRRATTGEDRGENGVATAGGKKKRKRSERTKAGAPVAVVDNERYKTELCRTFEESGDCRYGEKCQYAHGKAELRVVDRHVRYKTDLCKTFHAKGLCPYGARCHFIHNERDRLGGVASQVVCVASEVSQVETSQMMTTLDSVVPSKEQKPEQSQVETDPVSVSVNNVGDCQYVVTVHGVNNCPEDGLITCKVENTLNANTSRCIDEQIHTFRLINQLQQPQHQTQQQQQYTMQQQLLKQLQQQQQPQHPIVPQRGLDNRANEIDPQLLYQMRSELLQQQLQEVALSQHAIQAQQLKQLNISQNLRQQQQQLQQVHTQQFQQPVLDDTSRLRYSNNICSNVQSCFSTPCGPCNPALSLSSTANLNGKTELNHQSIQSTSELHSSSHCSASNFGITNPAPECDSFSRILRPAALPLHLPGMDNDGTDHKRSLSDMEKFLASSICANDLQLRTSFGNTCFTPAASEVQDSNRLPISTPIPHFVNTIKQVQTSVDKGRSNRFSEPNLIYPRNALLEHTQVRSLPGTRKASFSQSTREEVTRSDVLHSGYSMMPNSGETCLGMPSRELRPRCFSFDSSNCRRTFSVSDNFQAFPSTFYDPNLVANHQDIIARNEKNRFTCYSKSPQFGNLPGNLGNPGGYAPCNLVIPCNASTSNESLSRGSFDSDIHSRTSHSSGSSVHSPDHFEAGFFRRPIPSSGEEFSSGPSTPGSWMSGSPGFEDSNSNLDLSTFRLLPKNHAFGCEEERRECLSDIVASICALKLRESLNYWQP